MRLLPTSNPYQINIAEATTSDDNRNTGDTAIFELMLFRTATAE
jgi:hypothetical protein